MVIKKSVVFGDRKWSGFWEMNKLENVKCKRISQNWIRQKY